LGTLINIVTVLVGGLLGSLLGDRLPQRTRDTVMSGLGLMTLVVGLQMALTTQNVLIPMISLLAGAVIGEWWGIEAALERLGRWFERRLGAPEDGAAPSNGGKSVAKAFVTASLVFCIGPMSILGSVQDGLTGDYHLLAIKSVLDGFAALAFAASLGPGVLLSALSVGVYQGGITLATYALSASLAGVTRETPGVIEMTATGGVLIMGISLLLLDLRQVRVGNLLPAVIIAPVIVWLLGLLGVSYA